MRIETRIGRDARGELLLDALIAIALVGCAALGSIGLLHRAVRLDAEARRLDLALAATRAIVAELDGVSWHRLPQHLAIDPTSVHGARRSDDPEAPPAWSQQLVPLPAGLATITIDGLADGGGAAPLGEATALALEVDVSFADGGRRRHVRLRLVRT